VKPIFIVALMAPAMALAACSSEKAEKLENAYDNAADRVDNEADRVEAAADNMVGAAQNKAENVADQLENHADALREAGERKADEIDKRK